MTESTDKLLGYVDDVADLASKLVTKIEKFSTIYDSFMDAAKPILDKTRAETRAAIVSRAETLKTVRETGLSEMYAWKLYRAYREETTISDRLTEKLMGVFSSLVPLLMTKKMPPTREEMLQFISNEVRGLSDEEFDDIVKQARRMRAEQHAAEHCHESGCTSSEPPPSTEA